jgi:hypothetical protein
VASQSWICKYADGLPQQGTVGTELRGSARTPSTMKGAKLGVASAQTLRDVLE